MVSGRDPRLLLVLLLAASSPSISADDCLSSSVSSVRLSASSYRNMTGHWMTKAVITRRNKKYIDKLKSKERPMQYDIDITRQGCGDDETLITTFSVLVPPPRVGADYTFFPGVGYYKLHTEKMNWENARRTCEKEGAHLAIINSEAEENAIAEVMTPYATEGFRAFIGFHDMLKEGEYITVFGDPLNSTGRLRWGKGEPNNNITPESPEGEDCGDIYPDGNFNDVPCSHQLPFLCQQGL